MTLDKDQVIMVVDDSDDDYEITEFAMRAADIQNPVHRCADGLEALNYLNNPPAQAQAQQLPAMILLDLNMPNLDGKKVLEKLRANQGTKGIPVVIFSNSNDPLDIHACYRLGANSYIQKPFGLDSMEEVFRNFKNFWFETAHLPVQ